MPCLAPNYLTHKRMLCCQCYRPLLPTGCRPFECLDCGKTFGRKSGLRIHTASVHDESKSYLCPECGSSFKSNSALIDHRKRIHLQIRSHRCDHCGKDFFSKKDYVEHSRTHTGEKPFQCQACGKCFGRQNHLKRHTLGVHRLVKECPGEKQSDSASSATALDSVDNLAWLQEQGTKEGRSDEKPAH